MSSMYGNTGLGNKAPSGYQVGRVQNYSPEQMNLFRSLFSHVGPESYLSKLAGGDEATFAQMEAPALRQFSGIQGNLASRFSGMGLGGRHSSGFQNTINQASSDFAQDLQSRRQQLQQQAIRDLLGLSGDLLGQKPYEQFLMEKDKPFWQKIVGGALPVAGAGIGAFFGGPMGAQIGGSIGSSASKAFF